MARATAMPSQFGHYILDRKLAEGGMAEVFLARQQGLGGFEKQVVVKRILPSMSNDQAFISMFLNEARLAAKLSHSNVVQVIEAGEVGGQYYMAMEYIDGADLRLFYEDADRTGKPTPPGIACRVIADLLGGLHYAHMRTDDQGRPLGIVHRDVSPQNVLVTRTGTVKIVDFGIAKATRASAEQTRVGHVKGKIAYLSPEQAMGKPLDARTDVFACGILLWELVTGARLFARSNDMAAIMAITEDDIPLPRAVRPELPAALDELLSQALARPLADRFASAQAMQRELESLITAQGWQGDRRTLERYMQSRVPSHTPQFGADAMAEVRGHVQGGSDFTDGPTMLADSDPSLKPPASATPVAQSAPDKATLSLASQKAEALPTAPPPPAPPAPIQAAAQTVLQAPVVSPVAANRPRTPSGMRSMPPTPGPAAPAYGAPPPAYQPFDGPTARGHGASTLRRVLVVLTIAAMVSVGTILAVDWSPQPTSTGSGARLVIEVTEPAVIDVEGRRTRIDSQGEIEIVTGRQLSLTATTARGAGKQATRTIDVPPATAAERIALKINFPD
jgi:serine/threonine protein kinase